MAEQSGVVLDDELRVDLVLGLEDAWPWAGDGVTTLKIVHHPVYFHRAWFAIENVPLGARENDRTPAVAKDAGGRALIPGRRAPAAHWVQDPGCEMRPRGSARLRAHAVGPWLEKPARAESDMTLRAGEQAEQRSR